MLKRTLAIAALAFSAAFGNADPGIPPQVGVVPSRTGVLLLPPLDTEPWSENVLPQRQLVVRRRAEYEFITRQFRVSGERLALAAASRLPAIDLASAQSRTPAALDALAGRTGVNWVVSMTVQEVAADPQSVDGDFHCHCRLLLQVRDATHHLWLENQAFVGRDLGGRSSPVWLFKESIDEAARQSVSQFLSPFKEVVKVAPVTSVGDYLKGQTEAFIGDPKVTFLGFGKAITAQATP